MTEAEWNACTDPEPMLEFLRGKASDRKLRWFAIACCLRVLHLATSEESYRAIQAAELFADGLMTGEALFDLGHARTDHTGFTAADDAACWLYNKGPVMVQQAAMVATYACTDGDSESEQWRQAREPQAMLLRDVFGSLPFRNISIDPCWLAWNNGAVAKLAQAIYDDRAFDRVPILADALEDAGCHDAAILDHCRGPGAHVRGCWVVDLLLGRT